MSQLRPEELYDEDFFAWTQQQARELRRFARTRPNLPLDLRHVAEEIQDLGKEQRDALRSWTGRIIEHLLLLEHSPADDPRRGWISEIITFRRDIERRLTATLRRDLIRRLPKLYSETIRDLDRKFEFYGEGLAAQSLPERCPYTLDQVLGDWWPEDPMRPRPGSEDAAMRRDRAQ
ncbi:MAG: DUF29 domain-containing protein [Geminicoccaceae bacterium]|nr:DUF29 domain-containing protein [Geminicoccaceae bacterium]